MESAVTLDRPNQIEAFRLLALKGALKLETVGLKSRYHVADQIRGIIGSTTKNKQRLLDEYIVWLTDNGILR